MSLNLAMILRESARAYPEKPALVLGQSTLSYAQTYAYAQRFAGGLAKLGVKPGQHVAEHVDVRHLVVEHEQPFPYQVDGDYLGEPPPPKPRHARTIGTTAAPPSRRSCLRPGAPSDLWARRAGRACAS